MPANGGAKPLEKSKHLRKSPTDTGGHEKGYSGPWGTANNLGRGVLTRDLWETLGKGKNDLTVCNVWVDLTNSMAVRKYGKTGAKKWCPSVP